MFPTHHSVYITIVRSNGKFLQFLKTVQGFGQENFLVFVTVAIASRVSFRFSS